MKKGLILALLVLCCSFVFSSCSYDPFRQFEDFKKTFGVDPPSQNEIKIIQPLVFTVLERKWNNMIAQKEKVASLESEIVKFAADPKIANAQVSKIEELRQKLADEEHQLWLFKSDYKMAFDVAASYGLKTSRQESKISAKSK